MKSVVKLLEELNYTISSCESVTGGLFSKTITDVPNASKVFAGSIIAYNRETKIKIVKIKAKLLEKYTVVSPECALAMAKNTKKIFKTNLAISFTGNAGPSGSEMKPVGLIYFAIVFDDYFLVKKIIFQGTRSQIRQEIIKKSVNFLIENLKKIKKESSK